MRPHPALTELGNVEHPFLYAPMIETFFRAASDYLIEVDEEHGAVRFTHSPTSKYVVMARSRHLFGRPDLVLPWGFLRIRYLDGKYFKFAQRQLDNDSMFNFINNRVSNDGQQYNAVSIRYSNNIAGNVLWHRTLLNNTTVTRLRAYQYDLLDQVVARSDLLEEQHLEKVADLNVEGDHVTGDSWMDD